jgi:putative transcriptional regulator
MESINNLKHHFLLAMPQMNDRYFGQSVCYICDHSENGSMGLVINKPTDVSLADIFSELAINPTNSSHINSPAVLQGGPVSLEQGFVLYNGTSNNVENKEISHGVRLSTSKAILVNIAHGVGPENALVCLGYAGWEAGQLEDEIANNAWLTVEADETLLFHTPAEDIAKQAANKLGIDLSLLSSLSGHA